MDRIEELQQLITKYDKEMEKGYRKQKKLREKIEALSNEQWELKEAQFWKDHPGVVLEQNSRWLAADGIVLTYTFHYEDDETGEVMVFMNCEPITLERARKLQPATAPAEGAG